MSVWHVEYVDDEGGDEPLDSWRSRITLDVIEGEAIGAGAHVRVDRIADRHDD